VIKNDKNKKIIRGVICINRNGVAYWYVVKISDARSIMRLVEGPKEKEYKSSIKPLKSSEIEEKRWMKN